MPRCPGKMVTGSRTWNIGTNYGDGSACEQEGGRRGRGATGMMSPPTQEERRQRQGPKGPQNQPFTMVILLTPPDPWDGQLTNHAPGPLGRESHVISWRSSAEVLDDRDTETETEKKRYLARPPEVPAWNEWPWGPVPRTPTAVVSKFLVPVWT